jgi:molybdopterin synthase sulfur carrier subunit
LNVELASKEQAIMAVNVRIPEVLRKLTGGSDIVAVEAATVKEMIEAIEKAHPGLKERICDENGNVRRFINVFVNEEDIRFQENLETKLSSGTEVSILPAIAGGAGKSGKKSADFDPLLHHLKPKEAGVPPAEFTRRVYLTFNREQCTQPIIYHMVKKFDVVPNIRGASVTEDLGIMSVEVSGTRDNVEQALEWVRKQGLKVDPIEMNVVEP